MTVSEIKTRAKKMWNSTSSAEFACLVLSPPVSVIYIKTKEVVNVDRLYDDWPETPLVHIQETDEWEPLGLFRSATSN